jgi:hypothetical protein
MARFSVLQSLLFGMLIYGFHVGALHYVYEADKTKIVVLIAVAFLIALTLAPKKPEWTSWISHKLIDLGLLGTVAGFIIALNGVSIAAVNDPEQVVMMVTHLLSGMRTALFTTITGLSGYLWLSLTLKMK